MLDLRCGDCLEVMKEIEDNSIDLILCDLPYGNDITACKWDHQLNLEILWKEYKRIIKNKGIVCLTAIEPFTSFLVMSNLEMYRYKWVWQKEQGSNWQLAKVQPLNVLEDILIFSKAKSANGAKDVANYYPQKIKRKVSSKSGGSPSTSDILNKNSMKALKNTYDDSFPINLLYYKRVHSSQRVHPTQKPVELIEYLIKTYSNENDLILDNCMGSGTTGVACVDTNRSFIGIEKDPKYFEIAKDRIQKASCIQEKLESYKEEW